MFQSFLTAKAVGRISYDCCELMRDIGMPDGSHPPPFQSRFPRTDMTTQLVSFPWNKQGTSLTPQRKAIDDEDKARAISIVGALMVRDVSIGTPEVREWLLKESRKGLLDVHGDPLFFSARPIRTRVPLHLPTFWCEQAHGGPTQESTGTQQAFGPVRPTPS